MLLREYFGVGRVLFLVTSLWTKLRKRGKMPFSMTRQWEGAENFVLLRVSVTSGELGSGTGLSTLTESGN